MPWTKMSAPLPRERHCYRCIYSWTPRKSPVRICPRCKSTLWNVPKIRPVRLGHGLGIREVLDPFRGQILAVARRYGARHVRVFGSVRRQEATTRSDLDLLVDDLAHASLLDIAGLEVELRRVVGRPVVVVEESSLPWSMRPQVLAEALPL